MYLSRYQLLLIALVIADDVLTLNSEVVDVNSWLGELFFMKLKILQLFIFFGRLI